MGMPLGDDLQCTNCPDHRIPRYRHCASVLNLRPSPEFERWLESMGIMANGRLTKRAGDPSLFF